MFGALFEAADVPDIAKAAGLSLQLQADHGEVVRLLNDATTNFLLASQALSKAPPGELAAWCREVSARAYGLLETFALAHDRSDPVAAAGHVLQGPAGFIDHHAVPIDATAELRAVQKAVAALALRSRLAADDYEKRKGGNRKSPDIEVEFYRQLGAIYEVAFGERWSLSTTKDGQRAGGGIRFCDAVGDHLSKRTTEVSSRGEAAAAALRRMQNANSAAERIRDARSGGKVRKR